DLLERVLGKICQVHRSTIVRIGNRHRDELLILLAAVEQVEHPDRSHLDQASREGRLGHQHQHVDRVAIAGESPRHEAVVAGIVHRRVEHAVEPEDSQVLVELVLVALVLGDLDHRGDYAWWLTASGDVVPGVERAGRYHRSRNLMPGCGKGWAATAGPLLSLHQARVAEWQTQRTQNPIEGHSQTRSAAS